MARLLALVAASLAMFAAGSSAQMMGSNSVTCAKPTPPSNTCSDTPGKARTGLQRREQQHQQRARAPVPRPRHAAGATEPASPCSPPYLTSLAARGRLLALRLRLPRRRRQVDRPFGRGAQGRGGRGRVRGRQGLCRHTENLTLPAPLRPLQASNTVGGYCGTAQMPSAGACGAGGAGEGGSKGLRRGRPRWRPRRSVTASDAL